MSEAEHVSEFAENGLTLVEKVIQFSVCLQVISIVLALDIALSILKQSNLLSFDWQSGLRFANFGQILVFVAGYSFFMAAFAPSTKVLVDRFLGLSASALNIDRFLGRSWNVPDGYVLSHTLREKADEIGDSYLDNLIRRHEIKQQRRKREMATLSSCSFSCALLLAFDLAIPASFTRSIFILTIEESVVSIAFAIISVFLLASPWLIALFEDDFMSNYIYHPHWFKKLHPREPLYRAGLKRSQENS